MSRRVLFSLIVLVVALAGCDVIIVGGDVVPPLTSTTTTSQYGIPYTSVGTGSSYHDSYGNSDSIWQIASTSPPGVSELFTRSDTAGDVVVGTEPQNGGEGGNTGSQMIIRATGDTTQDPTNIAIKTMGSGGGNTSFGQGADIGGIVMLDSSHAFFDSTDPTSNSTQAFPVFAQISKSGYTWSSDPSGDVTAKTLNALGGVSAQACNINNCYGAGDMATISTSGSTQNIAVAQYFANHSLGDTDGQLMVVNVADDAAPTVVASLNLDPTPPSGQSWWALPRTIAADPYNPNEFAIVYDVGGSPASSGSVAQVFVYTPGTPGTIAPISKPMQMNIGGTTQVMGEIAFDPNGDLLATGGPTSPPFTYNNVSIGVFAPSLFGTGTCGFGGGTNPLANFGYVCTPTRSFSAGLGAYSYFVPWQLLWYPAKNSLVMLTWNGQVWAYKFSGSPASAGPTGTYKADSGQSGVLANLAATYAAAHDPGVTTNLKSWPGWIAGNIFSFAIATQQGNTPTVMNAVLPQWVAQVDLSQLIP